MAATKSPTGRPPLRAIDQNVNTTASLFRQRVARGHSASALAQTVKAEHKRTLQNMGFAVDNSPIKSVTLTPHTDNVNDVESATSDVSILALMQGLTKRVDSLSSDLKEAEKKIAQAQTDADRANKRAEHAEKAIEAMMTKEQARSERRVHKQAILTLAESNELLKKVFVAAHRASLREFAQREFDKLNEGQQTQRALNRVLNKQERALFAGRVNSLITDKLGAEFSLSHYLAVRELFVRPRNTTTHRKPTPRELDAAVRLLLQSTPTEATPKAADVVEAKSPKDEGKSACKVSAADMKTLLSASLVMPQTPTNINAVLSKHKLKLDGLVRYFQALKTNLHKL